MADNDDEQGPLPWLGQPVMPPDDEEASPTIGQRMAGMGSKPAPAPVDTPAPPMPQAPLDMSKLPPGLAPVQAAPSAIPTPPSGSSNPNLIDLAKQQAQYGKPLDPNAVDPATGKPKYKMGIGGKILGSLTNFASGFSKNPTTIDVGSGATNRQYARDEAMREGNLANTNTQIGTQEKLDNENEKIYRDAIKQAYEGQVGAARQGTAAAQKETADTRAALETSQAQLNQARANKADQDKAPTNEFSGWYSAFKETNKRNPSPQEIQQYEVAKARAGKDSSAADVQKAIQVAEFKSRQLEAIERQKESERDKRYKELDSNVALKYDQNKMAAEKAKVDQSLEDKYAPKVQSMSDEADKMLGLTKAGAKLQSPAKPTTSKIDPNNLPKTVQVRQKDGSLKTRTVQGYNKQTGKPILAPE